MASRKEGIPKYSKRHRCQNDLALVGLWSPLFFLLRLSDFQKDSFSHRLTEIVTEGFLV